MAKVMIAQRGNKVTFYVAKKDMEEEIKTIEFDTEERWGGEVLLEPVQKKIPNEVNAKRISS